MLKIWVTVSIGINPKNGSIYSQTDTTLSDSKEWAEGKALENFRETQGGVPLSVLTSLISDDFVTKAYVSINQQAPPDE